MSKTHDNPTQTNSGYEKRDLNITKTLIATVLIVIFLVASVAFVDEIFVHEKEQIITDVVLKPVSIQLRDLRAKEDEVLMSYKALDPKKGVYQIPIERAMKLVAEEAYANRPAENK
jgi:ABC-type lipopolysaccharide export system ATPase subunit